MGKNILVQRRGRGFFIFRAPTHRRLHPTGYNSVDGHSTGFVRDLLHEVARGAPLARLVVGSNNDVYIPAPEGMYVGQSIEIGSEAPAETGNIKSLGRIPEGTMICNIELRPGDGGTLARSSGSFALVVSHTPAGTELRMPSGRTIHVNDKCRAMIGVVAGAGRTEKPFLKATEGADTSTRASLQPSDGIRLLVEKWATSRLARLGGLNAAQRDRE